MIRNPQTTGINIGQELQSGFGSLLTDTDGTRYYVVPVAQIKTDLKYLWDKCGFRKIRQGMQGAVGGFQPIVDLQDKAAQLAKAQGFEVTYGLPITFSVQPGDWMPGFARQKAHALKMQAAGYVDVYTIANETEGSDYSQAATEEVVSVSRQSNVLTITMPRPIDLRAGDRIQWFVLSNGIGGTPVLGISGNTQLTITRVIDTTHFEISSGTGAVGANGSQTGGVWIQLGAAAKIGLIKRQATDLKASGVTMLLENNCLQGNASAQAGNYRISAWISAGRGDIDLCSLNAYGTGEFGGLNNLDGYINDFTNEITQMINAFGVAHCRVTEWSANKQSGLSVKPDSSNVLSFYHMRRFEIMDNLGIASFFFCYRQPLGAEGGVFAATMPSFTTVNQVWRDFWYVFVGQRSPTIESPFGTPVPISRVRNLSISYTPNWSGMGLNYGNDAQSGVYNAAQVASDIVLMKSWGITRVRTGGGDYTFAAGVAAQRQYALALKAAGFYVNYVGVSPNNNKVTDAQYAALDAANKVEAAWAWANGMDEYNCGNEIEYSETTYHILTNSVAKLQQTIFDIRNGYLDSNGNPVSAPFPADGVTRFLSYSMAQSSMDYIGAPGGWIQVGKGALDYLAYNGYGDSNLTPDQAFAQWKGRINDLFAVFGTSLQMSEFTFPNGTARPPSELAEGIDIGRRIAYLVLSGMQVGYFFTTRWDSLNPITSDAKFALIRGSVVKIWFKYMFTVTPRYRAHFSRTFATRTFT